MVGTASSVSGQRRLARERYVMNKVPIMNVAGKTGSYLGEDNIVRFEDQYGRAETGEVPR